MKILCCDIGTGTQDILLYDSRLPVENGYKLVLPSPTLMINRKLKAAAKDHRSVFLTGVTMGGGPSQWGAVEIIRKGGKVFATPDAARSFNDHLDKVASLGIIIVSQDEGDGLPADVFRIEMRDFSFQQIQSTFDIFGVSLSDLDAIAVAVFDHGNAPVDISDRKFRFDYLDERIRMENRLSAFAYLSNDIPESMTRLMAVAESAKDANIPLVVMDTAPAVVLGATLDPNVSRLERKIIVNIGNLHTLAFRLAPQGIEGCFEHHSGALDQKKLEHYLLQLADGSLINSDVFSDHGHGALVYSKEKFKIPEYPFGVIVTGPRRNIMMNSTLNPYFPAPFGDMMLTGCFGLLSAVGDLLPDFKDMINRSLHKIDISPNSPWDID